MDELGYTGDFDNTLSLNFFRSLNLFTRGKFKHKNKRTRQTAITNIHNLPQKGKKEVQQAMWVLSIAANRRIGRTMDLRGQVCRLPREVLRRTVVGRVGGPSSF